MGNASSSSSRAQGLAGPSMKSWELGRGRLAAGTVASWLELFLAFVCSFYFFPCFLKTALHSPNLPARQAALPLFNRWESETQNEAVAAAIQPERTSTFCGREGPVCPALCTIS